MADQCPGKCGGPKHFANAECDAVPLPTTGKISSKPYKCTHCGDVAQTSTNHWGEIYSACKNCSWKRPLEATVKVCLEPVPPGFRTPTPWKIVTLGEICDISDGSKQ